MKTFYTALLITAISAATVMAQQPGRGERHQGYKGDKKQRPQAERMEKMDLTAEQQAALKNLRQTFKMEMIDLRAHIQKTKLEVQNLLSQSTANAEAIMNAVDKEGAAELAMRRAVVSHQIKVRDIVGPEKAAQLRKKMMDRRGDGGGSPQNPMQDRPDRQED